MYRVNFKMKVILALAVIACFLAAASAQTQSCTQRFSELQSCVTSLTNPGSDFCNTCRDTLISYYNDCANGVGVDAVQQCKLNKYLYA